MTGLINSRGITVRQGNSFAIIMRFKLPDSDLDISGMKLQMRVRDEQGNLILDKAGAVSDAVHGTAVIELTPQDTDLPLGQYKTDIKATFADGQVHTIYPQNINAVAYFKVTEEVGK